jgi:hypothetical protein
MTDSLARLGCAHPLAALVGPFGGSNGLNYADVFVSCMVELSIQLRV